MQLNIIAAEYLQNISHDPRPLIPKSRVTDTGSSPPHQAELRVFFAPWLAQLWIVPMWFPCSDLGLERASATRTCHAAWEAAQQPCPPACPPPRAAAGRRPQLQAASAERCQDGIVCWGRKGG